jgi:hypothetical protein|tara:strand:- start:180 stop:404 length:225 start_codon:yes stop_codon:yes gene_type:complete
MTTKKITTKQKKNALFWSGLVADALKRFKSTHQPQVISVGTVKTAFMLQDTLTSMALSGEEAAWNIEIKLETLH